MVLKNSVLWMVAIGMPYQHELSVYAGAKHILEDRTTKVCTKRMGPIPCMPLENILVPCVPLAPHVIHTKNVPICHSMAHKE
jgi:hypothetical protein